LSDGTGVLVAKESPEEMAAAIITMCHQSPSDWQDKSDRAYRKAHSYSWDDAATRLLNVLQRPDDQF
jgi:glycosyltransferase involved in cell wall biosynthesis